MRLKYNIKIADCYILLINTPCSFCRVLMCMICIILLGSCKKFIEVDGPVTSTNALNVYTNDATAAAVLTGIYTKMSNSSFSDDGITSLSLFPGLSADELTLHGAVTNTAYLGYYRNALTNSNTSNTDYWRNIYPIIFVVNSAIEAIANSPKLMPAVKQQLMGEAKFIRAFCNFYLVNLYGDVPLVLSSDYIVNSDLSRTTQVEVYRQIIQDLQDAQTLLNSSYLKSDAFSPYPNGSIEKTRPNKWAATALLARAYLYNGDWANAEMQATAVITQSALYSLDTLNGVFLKNSKEAIWQLQPVNAGQNTQNARLFIIPPSGPTSSTTNPVYLNNKLLNSFEVGDQRKVRWVDSVAVGTTIYYYPYKYKVNTLNKPLTEYLMVLRLSELYLIRAEARAQRNLFGEAQADLNSIRTRAGLPNTTAADKASLLTSILHERQVELFTEWGHRWLDLKRTNSVDAVMGAITLSKGGTWNTNWQWYPIPLSELTMDLKLTQNDGY